MYDELPGLTTATPAGDGSDVPDQCHRRVLFRVQRHWPHGRCLRRGEAVTFQRGRVAFPWEPDPALWDPNPNRGWRTSCATLFFSTRILSRRAMHRSPFVPVLVLSSFVVLAAPCGNATDATPPPPTSGVTKARGPVRRWPVRRGTGHPAATDERAHRRRRRAFPHRPCGGRCIPASGGVRGRTKGVARRSYRRLPHHAHRPTRSRSGAPRACPGLLSPGSGTPSPAGTSSRSSPGISRRPSSPTCSGSSSRSARASAGACISGRRSPQTATSAPRRTSGSSTYTSGALPFRSAATRRSSPPRGWASRSGRAGSTSIPWVTGFAYGPGGTSRAASTRAGISTRPTLACTWGPRWLAGARTDLSVLGSARRSLVAGSADYDALGSRFEVRRRLTPRVSVTGRASWHDRRYREDLKLDGPARDLSLSGSWAATPTVRLDGALGYGTERPELVRNRNTSRWLRVGVQKALPRGFAVGASAQVRWTDYEGEWPPHTPPGELRKDRTRTLSASVHHRRFTLFGFSPELAVTNEAPHHERAALRLQEELRRASFRPPVLTRNSARRWLRSTSTVPVTTERAFGSTLEVSDRLAVERGIGVGLGSELRGQRDRWLDAQAKGSGGVDPCVCQRNDERRHGGPARQMLGRPRLGATRASVPRACTAASRPTLWSGATISAGGDNWNCRSAEPRGQGRRSRILRLLSSLWACGGAARRLST